MKILKKAWHFLLVATIFCLAPAMYADVYEITGSFGYGLGNDSLTGYVAYDETLVNSATSELPVDSLELTWSNDSGTTTWNETNDIDFGGGLYPAAVFFDGVFSGIAFWTGTENAYDIDAFLDSFLISSLLPDQDLLWVAEGTLAYSLMQQQPIPEPSTMLLLGSGLFGMVAVGYRRRRAR